MRRARSLLWTLALLLGVLVDSGLAADSSTLLARIKAVGKQGQGNADAGKAWKELVEQGPAVLFDVLKALDEDNAVSTNWLRPAVDAIAEKAIASPKGLPQRELEAFVKDVSNPPLGRRAAYELLVAVDGMTPARLLPGMLKDPSADLRRDAVAVVLKEAEALLKKDKDAAKSAFKKALDGAADEDQVNAIAKHLETLGEKIDVAGHLGFVKGWHLIAAFDNTNAAHFQTVHPPEKGVELKETYKGKTGDEVRWHGYVTEDGHGEVDLNRLFGNWKAGTAYAFAVIDSVEERRVQVRLGSPNAIKLFVNGKEVLAHEEYHHGALVDQYVATASLKPGRNELLLKICQNEKKESWEKDWKFQARLCDSAGAAVPFTQKQVKSELKLREQPKDKK